jgi:RNA polymerase sigma-32 factor
MAEVSVTPISSYLRNIDRYQLLSQEEEARLAVRWKNTRDQEAGRRLVLCNLRFVVKIAFEYRTYGVRMLDLIQEGNLGLLVAVERFDAGRGNRLTTYAVWWIRAYVHDYIRRQWSLVRFGTTRAEQRCFYRLRREREKLERSGETVDPARLASALGVAPDAIGAIEARIVRRDQSLDDPAFAGAEETKVSRLPDEAIGPEREVIDRELLDLSTTRVRRALAGLDPRERAIIEKRYLEGDGTTLKELGKSFGISRERVRQLEARAKEKMKAELADVWAA